MQIGFIGLLTIVFIFLKLTHYIHWSWWWILSPLWITLVLCLLFFAFVAVAQYREEIKLERNIRRRLR